MFLGNDFTNFFIVLSGQLKFRISKKSVEPFLKKCNLKFLLNKAKSDLRAKSLNKALFEATHCQNVTKL